MSLFFRASGGGEQRAISMDEWMRGFESNARTRSGETVTTDKALGLGAVWSSTNLLASIVANLPVDVFRGTGATKTPVNTPPALVETPSLIVSRSDWVYQAMMSLLLRGNAYGMVVERDPLLRPRTVEWLDPDAVEVHQASSLRPPTYRVSGQDVPRGDIIHVPAFLKPGSAVGMSPVAYHAEGIGLGLAAQKHGAQWFGDGAHPTAILHNKTQKALKPEVAKKVKARFMEVLRGGGREPLVLGSDWEYKPIQVSAAEAQFLQTQGYTDAQVAKLYGPGIAEVLGYSQAGGGSLTYSNRVDRSLDLLTYAVLPWVRKLEELLTSNIARPQTVRFNTNGLLRADPKTRHEMYRIDREIGLYSIDELRALEDLPPLPNGQGADYSPLKGGTSPAPAGDTEGNEDAQ